MPKSTKNISRRKRENELPVSGSQLPEIAGNRQPINGNPTMTDPTQHRYIPNADQDVKEMLAVIGVDSIDRLFDSIPNEFKLARPLEVPGPWSEIEARRWFRELAARNKSGVDHLSFLGGGGPARSH